MNRIKLVLPTDKYKEQLMAYKAAFLAADDNLAGSGGLREANTFEEWYAACCDNRDEKTVREGLVPATTFLVVSIEDEELVGMVDIRHRLNDYLLKYGGHIGYSVKPSKRRQGYATELLSLALQECLKLNITKVLITCDHDNMGSAKTIMKNGGVFENELLQKESITKRFWIDLSKQ